MAEHALSRETYQVAFDPSVPPALEIDPGDTVTFETGSDAYERLAGGESVDAIGLPNFNRVTGPVAVRGAEPGDALAIEVLDVQVRKAFSVWLPGFGGLGGRTDEQRVMETPLEDGRAVIGTARRVRAHPADDRLHRHGAGRGQRLDVHAGLPVRRQHGSARDGAGDDALPAGQRARRAAQHGRPARGDGHGRADLGQPGGGRPRDAADRRREGHARWRSRGCAAPARSTSWGSPSRTRRRTRWRSTRRTTTSSATAG